MKTAIIFLDYQRHEHRKQALKSIACADYPFDLFTIDMFGIGRAINTGFDMTRQYDAVVICGNDIVVPDGWLAKMVEYTSAIPETGMCGIHCVETIEKQIECHGKMIHPTFCAFGNVMIPRHAIDTIGYFNEKHDPYGMHDSDYAYRLTHSGFVNYYIPGLQSNHIGHDVGNGTEYRAIKDKGLAMAGVTYLNDIEQYNASENYTIFERQMI
jgi:glycosyltransferase involved in cell wall biosynthesis